MTLDVDKEKMMIMGVIFDNKKVFKSVWFALSTNMIEGWHPTVEDVERLKEEAVALGEMCIRDRELSSSSTDFVRRLPCYSTHFEWPR